MGNGRHFGAVLTRGFNQAFDALSNGHVAKDPLPENPPLAYVHTGY